MLEFEWIWLFLLLPLPLFLRLFTKPVKQHREQALHVPFLRDFQDAPISSKANSFSWLILALSIVGWIALVTAVARPIMVGENISLYVKGRNIMMAIDLSGSMREADYRVGNQWVDRLTATKFVASEFIQRRKGDRLGLILFGDQAYLQTPLTFDRQTILKMLDESALGLAGQKTAIGDAIGLAVKRLRKENEQDRVLILLTDGSNTAGNVDPLKAADLASQEKVKIYTIGVGSPRSSDIDEPTLKAIAEKTNGRYFRARDVEGLLEIYKVLDEIEPVSKDELSYRPITELFYYPLAFALGLSVFLALIEILSHFIRFSLNLPQNLKKARE